MTALRAHPATMRTVLFKYGAQTTARDLAVGRAMSAYLVNFARSGDPNGAGLPDWPRYTPGSDTIVDFADDGSIHAGRDPWGAEIDAAAQATPNR